MYRLPVFPTVGAALAAPVRHAWPLVPVFLLMAFILGGLAGFLWNAVDAAPPDELMSQGHEDAARAGYRLGFALMPLIPLFFLMSAAFVVIVHRTVAQRPDRWRFVGRTFVYIGVSFVVSLLVGLLSIPLSIAMSIYGAVAPETDGPDLVALAVLLPVLIPVLLVCARLSLALPAAALGQPSAISTAFRISKGNVLRLGAGYALYFIAAFAILALLYAGLKMSAGLPLVPEAEAAPAGGSGGLTTKGREWYIAFLLLQQYFLSASGAAFLTHAFLGLSAHAAPPDEPETFTLPFGQPQSAPPRA